MSMIDEMVKQLCPDGVEYIELAKLADIGTGSSDRKDAIENGKYPFFVRSKEILAKDEYEYDEEAVIIPGEGGVGEIFHYVNGPYALHQRVYRIHLHDDRLNTRFLLRYMESSFRAFILKKAVSATVTSIRKPMIQQFPVPIPPMEIQQEIVRVLGSFAELEAELETELEARQCQFSHYRDELLDFSGRNDVRWLSLGDVAAVYDGTHQTPKYVSEGIRFVSVENINAPYASEKYITQEAFDRYKVKPSKGDVLMTRIGTIGLCSVLDRDEDLAYYVSLALIRPDTELVRPRYLKYIIESSIGRRELRKRTLVNAVPIKVNLGDVGKIEIPVPQLEEQERIIAILDKFDMLCNDIYQGLPAEIDARRRQYAYYRDKLLTFKEKVA